VVGRRAKSVVFGRMLTPALVLVLTAGLLALSAKHPREWDVTRSAKNQLQPRTVEALTALDQPLDVILFRPNSERFDGVYVEVERLLERMAKASPQIRLRAVDAALEPEKTAALAEEFALSLSDFGEGGAIVLELSGRRRVIELLDMAEFGRDALGAGAMVAFRAEGALLRALVELQGATASTICHSEAHGELARTAGPAPDVKRFMDSLERDGFALRSLGPITADALQGCDVLMLLGPTQKLVADEILAVGHFLEKGGGLFLALASDPDYPQNGLEVVLGGYRLQTPRAVVLDPKHEVGIPLAWMTSTGYGAHSIAAPFQGRRLSVWLAPRPVLGGEPLVSASPAGWGERDLDAVQKGEAVAADEADILSAPIAAAVERGQTRVVVFGSAVSLSNLLANRGMTGASVLARAALSWLAGRSVKVDVPDRRVEPVRLILDAGQKTLLFWICVVCLPMALLSTGGIVFLRRRR
jgi:hypothetical protein